MPASADGVQAYLCELSARAGRRLSRALGLGWGCCGPPQSRRFAAQAAVAPTEANDVSAALHIADTHHVDHLDAQATPSSSDRSRLSSLRARTDEPVFPATNKHNSTGAPRG
jgi:hypothetical protein